MLFNLASFMLISSSMILWFMHKKNKRGKEICSRKG
jgi:hypothetical protein